MSLTQSGLLRTLHTSSPRFRFRQIGSGETIHRARRLSHSDTAWHLPELYSTDTSQLRVNQSSVSHQARKACIVTFKNIIIVCRKRENPDRFEISMPSANFFSITGLPQVWRVGWIDRHLPSERALNRLPFQEFVGTGETLLQRSQFKVR